ncbi:MAG TPA: TadE/TadG family type IV pilus assembly protein [Bryobacteraceae bacterium]|jgi:Flp pilus assembly protein TadG
MEFTLVMLPLLSMIFILLNITWAVFTKSTLQRAVRIGVRAGISTTSTTSGTCLTDLVKSTVEANSMGLLNGTTGLGYIKVNYYMPPASNTNTPPTDVSSALNADNGGNIMQVSVQGYSLLPIVPRIYDWKQAPDKNPLIVNVYAADIIEPSRTPPCVGTAP